MNTSSTKTTCQACGCESIFVSQVPKSIGFKIFPIIDPSSLYFCHTCGFLANEKSNESSYTQYHTEFKRHSQRSQSLLSVDQNYYHALLSKLSSFVDFRNDPFSSCLDVGPGDNVFSGILTEYTKATIDTYDIGQQYPSKTYDLITLFHTFEHWHSPKKDLASFAGLLNPFGLMYITVPDLQRYSSTYYGAYAAIDSEHINHFSAYSLQTLLNLIGLKVISWAHSDRQVSESIYYPEIQIIAARTENNFVKEDLVPHCLRIKPSDVNFYLAKSQRDWERVSLAVRKFLEARTGSEGVVIYGLGIHARRLAHAFPELILADSHQYFHGKNVNGREILNLEKLKDLFELSKLSFIVVAVNSQRIYEYLLSHPEIIADNVLHLTAGRHTFPEDQDFRAWRESVVLRNKTDSYLLKSSLHWQDIARKRNYQYLPEWFGRPIIQDPQDILAVQEVVFKVKPSLIIETGIARGGSMSLSASLLAAISYGEQLSGQPSVDRRVLGIDIDIRSHNMAELDSHPLRNMMSFIESSSIASSITSKLSNLIRPDDVVMVILDSDHSRDHVYSELCIYAPYVTLGSFIIVQDTGLEDADQESFNVTRAWGIGNGPKTAVNNFLLSSNNIGFHKLLDLPDKYLITSSRDGFLQRL